MGGTVSGAAVAVRSPLLIGRDTVLDLAERRMDEVRAGNGQFLLLAGVAGIGKTRVLDAIRTRAVERDFRAAAGTITPQDQEVRAGAILDLARDLRRVPAQRGLGTDLLARTDAATATVAGGRRRLVMDLVEMIATRTTAPTVLAFDDLQWADDLSLEIIAELARQTSDRPVLLIGGYRSDEAPPGSALRAWRSTLLTQRRAEEIRLAPLDRADTAMVTALVLGTGLPAPRDVVDAVFERTDGIPLHIEELMGALEPSARTDGSAIREATVPDTIEDAVLARLRHRSAAARTVAYAGAVIGRRFDAHALASVMDVPPETIDAPLQELVEAFLLVSESTGGAFDFRHRLLRDAIYRSVPARDRRRWHARAAVLGAGPDGRSVIHASQHYEQAGMWAEAYASAMAGAREAERLSAHREAFELYRRAAARAPVDQSALERGALYAAYAYQAAALERIDVSIEAATTAGAAYRAAGRVDLALRIADVIASMARRQGRPTSERAAVTLAAIAEAAELEDSPSVTRLRATLGLRHVFNELDAFDLDGAARTVEAARADALAVEDLDQTLAAETLLGILEVHAGRIDEGLAHVERTAQAQEAHGFEEALGSYRDGAEIAFQHVRYATARRLIEAGTQFAEMTEQRHCAHVMVATSGLVGWAEGHWDAASVHAEQALADDGCLRAKAVANAALGLVAMGRGDTRRATSALRSAIDYADEGEVTDQWLTPMWGLAEATLLAGQPAAAFELVEGAAARAHGAASPVLLVPFLVTGVRAAILAGRPDEAATWLDAQAPRLAAYDGVAAPALHHARGLLTLADGATGKARGELEAAIVGWDELGRVWEGAWARLDLAHCLIRSNRFAEALGLTLDVHDTAVRVGAPSLRERADALGRMARGHVSDDEPWRPLTSREFAVAKLISAGMTNAEIADELGIAAKTASSHVEHILAKLGAARRAEVAAWASGVERQAAAAEPRRPERGVLAS